LRVDEAEHAARDQRKEREPRPATIGRHDEFSPEWFVENEREKMSQNPELTVE
jgi:hypothetical protein